METDCLPLLDTLTTFNYLTTIPTFAFVQSYQLVFNIVEAYILLYTKLIMSEPEENIFGDSEIKSRLVWEPIVRAQREGKELTLEQQRALEIRRTTLSLADAINQLLRDPTIKSKVAREAEVIAQYYQAILKLQDLGIKASMHAMNPQGIFENPKKMAEYVAGQLIGIEGDKLPNVRQALPQVQEHSEGSIPVSDETSTFVIPTDKMSPQLKNFAIATTVVDLAHTFLASDLDKPS